MVRGFIFKVFLVDVILLNATLKMSEEANLHGLLLKLYADGGENNPDLEVHSMSCTFTFNCKKPGQSLDKKPRQLKTFQQPVMFGSSSLDWCCDVNM